MAKFGITLVTPTFRVSYPKIFTPEFNKLSKQDEYSLVALFKHGEDLKELYEAAKACVIKQWGDKPANWPKNLKSPFKDQGEKEKEDEKGQKVLPDGLVKGAIMINMKSKKAPGIIGRDKKPIIDAEHFYAGCYARANVYISAFEFDNGLNRGVRFALNHLQKMADGEPFSGRPKAEDCFEALDDSPAAADDTSNPFA